MYKLINKMTTMNTWEDFSPFLLFFRFFFSS